MQVVNKKMCVIVILVLVIIESCTLFLMYKSYGNKNTNLDEVNLNINNTNMFAIMLEQDDGTYKEDTTNTWPTSGYTYNESMSGCIDINGNRIEDALTYDKENNKASVNTTNTSYCYLYFKKAKTGIWLIKNPTSGLTANSLEAGMYRYQGNSINNDIVNNYVCFGTNNKADCTNNTDAHMYRIIGIKENGQMKLIKKEALNIGYAWHNSNSDVGWDKCDLFKGINGSYFLTNIIYVPKGWESKISTTTWKYGDTTSYGNYDGTTMYDIENPFGESTATNKFTLEVSSKIGLMYIHDYYYAYAKGGTPESYNNAGTTWIHLSKNDTSPPNAYYERTMTRYNASSALCVHSEGGISALNFHPSYSVRPVFYLTSDVEIIGGTGAIDDPFIIK